MDERDIQRLLLEILYAALNGTPWEPGDRALLTQDVLTTLYRLAKRHDLAHIVSQILHDSQVPVDANLKKQLQSDAVMSVYRCEQLKFAGEEIGAIFEQAEIPYIPLKGSVIRPYYPLDSMRTSCDIDVLVHEDRLEQAIAALEEKGYTRGKRRYHDVAMYSPNRIHLELHFHIREHRDNLDTVLQEAWNYAVCTQGQRYDFRKDFFTFHLYAHAAYHFLSGGCGLRTLMDFWVMEHRMDCPCTCAKELLQQAGIYRFAEEMSGLANRCFTEKDSEVVSDAVLQYIFQGGVYGSAENSSTVKKTETQSAAAYLVKRLFMPYESMTIAYPVLKRAPYLLPFCWMARWGTALFGGKSKRVASEISRFQRVSDVAVAEVDDIRSRLEI